MILITEIIFEVKSPKKNKSTPILNPYSIFSVEKKEAILN